MQEIPVGGVACVYDEIVRKTFLKYSAEQVKLLDNQISDVDFDVAEKSGQKILKYTKSIDF